jgi:hypothetical protein
VTYTGVQWAIDFLAELGAPRSGPNVQAIYSWEIAESGQVPSPAQFNPLNTTQDWPNATPFNWNDGDPVKNYWCYSDGIAANAKAIRNGNYPAVLEALSIGDDAQAVVDAVIASPWGTRHIDLINIGPITPPPAEGVETMIVVYSPHKPILAGRRPSAKWDPANPNQVICENGCSIWGDQPTSDPLQRIWKPVDAQGRSVVPVGLQGEGIGPSVDKHGRPDGKGIVMMFTQHNTYDGPWSLSDRP